MRGNGELLRSWLLGGLVVAAAWRPPELDGVGLGLTAALTTGLGLVLLASGAGDSLAARPARTPLLLLGLYLAASLYAASAPHPAASFLAGLVPAGVAFAASRAAARDGSGGKAVETALVTAATGAALLGIYQALAGLDRTARELRALGIAELDSLVIRAEGGRAFGPFLLPSALGMFLALALPLTLRRMLECRPRPLAVAAWGGLVLVQALGMAASRSYGPVVALAGAAALLAVRPPLRRRAGPALLAIAVVAGGTGLGIFAGRGAEGLSPLALRAGNWRVAAGIFLEHPLLGVGFGNFRDYYPARMEPGMNESAYAHSSYLQAAAEGGLPALLVVVGGALALAAGCLRLAGSGSSPRHSRALAALPPLAFLFHNLVDFSAYLPSLLIAFAALAGAVPETRRSDPEPDPGRPPTPGRAVRGLLAAALLGWAALQLREARVISILADARWAMAMGRVEAAIPLLERAAVIDPRHPDPPAALAELLLASGPDDPGGRAEGERHARLAAALRPRRAFGHFLLSRYRLAGGDPSEAFVEAARAGELFPTRRQYVEEAERLKDFLKQSGSEGTPPHAP